jgi:hypothetical protein
MCEACQLATGTCIICGKCFKEHCTCDPCQHGKERVEDCTFCERTRGEQ